MPPPPMGGGMPPPPPMGGGMPGGGMPPPPGGGMGAGFAPNYGGYPPSQSDASSVQVAEQDEKLFNAADTLTNGGNDGAAAYLDRYRTGGMAVARGRPMGRGGVRQTEKGGAALTDKYGNLI